MKDEGRKGSSVPRPSSLIPRVSVRVGKIYYVNCLPFYHHLAAPDSGVEFFEAYPAKINQAMRAGEIDIAPVSSLEYLNHQKDYLLFPDFSVGSRDFSGSVLLISKEKIEGLAGEEIALTPESLSSAALLKILLKFKFKFENQFIPITEGLDGALRKRKAALVIGDEALFYRPQEFVYKYDLSELWWNWTEKPFCFAVWAVRRKFARSHPEETAAFARGLGKNLARNLADIEGLIRDALGLTFMDEKFPKIFGYLFNLNYGFDESMREGLELFFRLAKRLGISPAAKKLEFFK